MLSRAEVRDARRRFIPRTDRLSTVFGALADQTRYLIFRLLLEQSEICVTDVANVLGISVPAASQQLRILERSGLVERERMGQMICYTIRQSSPIVRSLIRVIEMQDGAKGTR